jgi:hypothetical protein
MNATNETSNARVCKWYPGNMWWTTSCSHIVPNDHVHEEWIACPFCENRIERFDQDEPCPDDCLRSWKEDENAWYSNCADGFVRVYYPSDTVLGMIMDDVCPDCKGIISHVDWEALGIEEESADIAGAPDPDGGAVCWWNPIEGTEDYEAECIDDEVRTITPDMNPDDEGLCPYCGGQVSIQN